MRSLRMKKYFGIVAILFALTGAAQSPADIEFFEREVRPLLSQNCFECHGPSKQKGGLRLDHINFILKGGETGVVLMPGQPDESKLVTAINYQDVDLQMPPKGKLPDEAIKTLTEWIQRGAPWPDEPAPSADTVGSVKEFNLEARKAGHWSWQPIQPQAVPAVQKADWSDHPVDKFLLARLEQEGLSPAPAADKYTMIRRAYFDLIGLPPSPEAIQAFIADDSPDAYSRMVDELIDSPGFGERWARHWMDLTRYAETHGHEGDYPIREAWRYRDYLIRAFNDDVPYDELVREHIAGDLIDNPRIHPERGTNESILATGFWFMHQATHAPVDVEQDHYDRIDNQIDVFGKAFMGMTVACARCHEHPFDAISNKDYYAIAGALRSSRQAYAYLDPHGKIAEGAKALRAAHQKGNEAVKKTIFAWLMEEVEANIAENLLAAREVTRGQWKPEDGAETKRPDIRFEDFENGFTKWYADGGAFANGPAAKPSQGFQGEALAVSYNGSDELVGKLISQPFIIDRTYIHFMVTGGNYPKSTTVDLIIDGDTVRTAHGRKNNNMYRERWDVSEYEGKLASIELVDKSKNSFGFIGADDFIFSDSPYKPGLIKRPIAAVAAEAGIDAGTLGRWVSAIDDVGSGDPFGLWKEMHGADAESFAEKASKQFSPASEELDEYVVFDDFNDGSIDDWFPDGEAFDPGIAATGAWAGGVNGVSFAPSGAIHSGLVSGKLQGTIRSKSFTIEHDNLHFRVAGSGGRVKLVVESYQLRDYNGILFGTTLFTANSGDNFYWYNMNRDVRKFKGARAYIEIQDDGDGYIVVDEIRFSDGNPPEHDPALAWNPILSVNGDCITNHTQLAAAYEDRVVNAANRFVNGGMSLADTELLGWLASRDLLGTSDVRTVADQHKGELTKIAEAMPAPVRATVMTEGTPENSPLLIRGNPGTPANEIPRRFLEAIAGAEQPPVEGSGRLELANRLLSSENPYPSRVAVNRIWKLLFGEGIVPTSDNFGVTGQDPTHPELLDYLAARFQDNGWSVKGLIRDLMHTEAYHMSSLPFDEVAENKDPNNALLHRMRVRRLEGEAIRDAVLATAGTLDRTMYGESVPIYLSPFMTYHRRPSESGPMDGNCRRTIYVEIRRNFLNPMLLAFDMPLPDTTVGDRTVSNVPAQGLIMMNDPFIVEQAKKWGESIAKVEAAPDEKIATLFMRGIGRMPSADELDRMRGFMIEQAQAYELNEAEANNSAQIWQDMCHVIYTLKEFIYVL